MNAHKRRLVPLAVGVVLIGVLGAGISFAASSPAAAAQSGTCFEPVPDPFAAGWVQEGTSPAQIGQAPLILNDVSSTPGEFVSFFCSIEDGLLANEIVLRPRLSIDPGFGTSADANTGVYASISDGSRDVRAVLLAAGPTALRIVIDAGGGNYSQGFVISSLAADFVLKRLPNGNAVLALPDGQSEEIGRLNLPPTNRKALEFGTNGQVPASSVSRWDRLGLPPIPPPDADGDGVPDASDNCPAVANSDQADGDFDGSGDACDPQFTSTPCVVRGLGFLATPAQSFAFTARFATGAALPKGALGYLDLAAKTFLKSGSITGLACRGREATLVGAGSLKSGPVVDFTVGLVDNGTPGAGADRFSIRWPSYTKAGTLGGGNVVVDPA